MDLAKTAARPTSRSGGVFFAARRTCGSRSFSHRTQLRQRGGVVRAHQITYVAEDGSKVEAQASESDFLLDVGEENGVEIPASCRGGMCGTCVCKLTSGEVDMSEATDLEGVLSPEQLQAGYILACSSRPKTDCTVEWKQDWGVSVLEEWQA